ncbi:NAD(P)H-dependent glycerol-3-phosphate dehydrogenase [Segetibacter sp.]|jgi:glycerol-3-phosphate dehydrogenase (NAD(P)+)|uniref:NAD(P)H-dependent glycerol-3-phosphate dehydrogenase n=1 Tax=Segetibacter sp. TaxID=2231182 RepID=UPI00261EF983|nr:NAD(P)H-dependent glycerol-3-phosphate dehydrogenase [Segetibacter sp.]MCW3081148.1 glycerol-3-phosphate dehydrogenase [Segetibacter sp.]
MQFGILGSGSWATALAKILTDNNNSIHWWIRNPGTINQILQRRHNPHYLSSAYFNTSLLTLQNDIAEVIEASDVLVIAVPSAFVESAFETLPANSFKGKKVMSAIKGILPSCNQLLNDYMYDKFDLQIADYFTVLGPCHAEEVASEKLSYLTFSGIDEDMAARLGAHFHTEYLNTVVNHDVIGVQYAAVLKNIYALGAGIAHGLEYGDNFLSVYIANAADEMVCFLKKVVGDKVCNQVNYASSVYLGDLLVTCYSLYSRNRTFGNMLGKGYSVQSAQLELNMVAEGYNASKCMFKTNQTVGANMPIAKTVYQILWQHLPAAEGFRNIEEILL